MSTPHTGTTSITITNYPITRTSKELRDFLYKKSAARCAALKEQSIKLKLTQLLGHFLPVDFILGE